MNLDHTDLPSYFSNINLAEYSKVKVFEMENKQIKYFLQYMGRFLFVFEIQICAHFEKCLI